MQTTPARPRIATGILAMLVSIAGFSIMGVTVRGERDLFGPNTAMLWRALVGLALVLPIAVFTRTSLLGRRSWLLLARGVAGTISLPCFLTAIEMTDLGTATALCYTYPIFASALSALFLGETMPRSGWIAIAIAWLGVAITVGLRPALGVGEIYGIVSGLLAGVAIHAVRALRREGECTLTILAQFFFISVVVALPGAYFEDARLGFISGSWRTLLVIGTSATLGQAGLTIAYRDLPTRLGSPLSLSVVPISMAGVFVCYGESPAPGAIVGTALLVLAVMHLARATGE